MPVLLETSCVPVYTSDRCLVYETNLVCEFVWGDQQFTRSLTKELLSHLAEMAELAERQGWTSDEMDMIKDWKAAVFCQAGHPDLWQPDEAENLARNVLSRHADHRGAQIRLAIALYENGKFDEARTILHDVRDAYREEDERYKKSQRLRREWYELQIADRIADANKLLEEIHQVDVKIPSSKNRTLGHREATFPSLYLAMIAARLNEHDVARKELDEVCARWGSCESFPHAARAYREAAALLGQPISAPIRPIAVPTESPLPVFEYLVDHNWYEVH